MTTLLIKNAHIISPDYERFNASVLVNDGVIQSIFEAESPLPSADKTVDAQGNMLIPGFIDVHIHGGMGYETTSPKKEAVKVIAEAKIKEGVTSFCPTTLTLSEEMLADALKNIEDYKKAPSGAKIIGTHLEGPYINPDCIGAQNPKFLRKPDFEEIKRLNAISNVSIISYAIETEGAVEFTRQLCDAGIVPSCGHTGATLEQFRQGQAAGLHRLTHFCNQMTKLHHREIGLVGAGLMFDDTYIEMICDKIHLCPDMIRLAFKVKPFDKIMLITDAMEATGLPDGDYQLGGLAVVVSNGAARLASNGALAGSTLQFNKALKNVYEETKLPLTQIIKTTSHNQAVNLGLGDKLGKIRIGYIADIAILDEQFNPVHVFVDGVQKF